MIKEDFQKIEQFGPLLKKETYREEGNGFIAIIVGLLLILILFVLIFGFKLNLIQTFISIVFIISFYIIILSFLLEKKQMKSIINMIIKTIEKPSIIIEKPVVREVVKEIEKPVIKEVEKPIYIEKPRKKLNIPRYDYVASTETVTYHKSSCRLGKLIKRKYKLFSNDPNFFKKKNFTPCKVCIQKLVKV